MSDTPRDVTPAEHKLLQKALMRSVTLVEETTMTSDTPVAISAKDETHESNEIADQLEEWADRITRYSNSGGDFLLSRAATLLRELAAANARADANEKDAERWRTCVDAQGVAVSIFNVDPPCWRYPEGDHLIAAIDAIRNGTEGAWCVPIDDGMRCPKCANGGRNCE